MNIKVNSSSALKKGSKTSKSKASEAESLGFASALKQASNVEQAETVEVVSKVDSVESFGLFDGGASVPTQSKQRGYYILDLLEELEQDILSGAETKVASKLEEALKSPALDRDSMPDAVRDLMDEIDARASIELEKLQNK